jgi:hypothetical protein
VARRLMGQPKLYAAFLLWLLSKLFEQLPESPTHNAMGSAWKRAKRLIIIRI